MFGDNAIENVAPTESRSYSSLPVREAESAGRVGSATDVDLLSSAPGHPGSHPTGQHAFSGHLRGRTYRSSRAILTKTVAARESGAFFG